MPHSHSRHTKRSSGFTLLETLVIIVIITVMTLLVLRAFPLARTRQKLIADTAQIQLWLRSSEADALNEVRPEDCLLKVGSNPSSQKHCSDRGVAMRGNQVVLFADIVSDQDYTEGGDFILAQHELATGTQSTTWQSFVFLASPPNITMYFNGQPLAPNQAQTIILESDGQTRELPIYPYRHLDNEAL